MKQFIRYLYCKRFEYRGVSWERSRPGEKDLWELKLNEHVEQSDDDFIANGSGRKNCPGNGLEPGKYSAGN